jgi:hypothetical protein
MKVLEAFRQYELAVEALKDKLNRARSIRLKASIPHVFSVKPVEDRSSKKGLLDG